MFGYFRFFLASMVLVSHIGFHFGLNQGIVAVVCFYMLSGYVVTGLLGRIFEPGPTLLYRFYAERCLRIFPLYLYLAGLTIAFVILTGTGHPQFSALRVLANLLIVPLNYYMVWDTTILQHPKLCLIPPAWSLGAELQAYVLLPFVVFSKRVKASLAIVSLIVSVAASANVLDPDYFGYRLVPGVFFMFVLGSCTYKCARDAGRADAFDRLFPLVCYVASVVSLAVAWRFGWLHRGHGLEVALGILIGLPALNLLARTSVRLPLDRLLGELSYGIFISHFLAQWSLSYMLGRRLSPVAAVTAVLAVSVILSLPGIFVVERPLFRFRRNLSSEPRPICAQPSTLSADGSQE
jgi:peptidoglycan/LPS O-acetylase OafA/YrhL